MKRPLRLLSLALTPLAAAAALALTPTPAHAASTFWGYATVYDPVDFDRYIDWSGGTIRDNYHYSGLVPGRSYRLDTWMPDPAGLVPTVKVQTPFVASATGSGDVWVDFTVDSRWHGKTPRVYNAVYDGPQSVTNELNWEASINILDLAEADGVATDAADGDRMLPATGGTVNEVMTYANLIPNRTYRLQIQVSTRDDSVAVRKIWTQFTTDSTGRGTVRYPIWLGPEYAGTIVNFNDSIYLGDKYVGGTASWKDEMYVHAPVAGNAVDALDGDKEIAATGGVIRETFTYSGLTPGRQYRVDVRALEEHRNLPPIDAQQYFVAGPSGAGSVTIDLPVPSTYSGHTLLVIDYLHDKAATLGSNSTLNNNWIHVA